MLLRFFVMTPLRPHLLILCPALFLSLVFLRFSVVPSRSTQHYAHSFQISSAAVYLLVIRYPDLAIDLDTFHNHLIHSFPILCQRHRLWRGRGPRPNGFQHKENPGAKQIA